MALRAWGGSEGGGLCLSGKRRMIQVSQCWGCRVQIRKMFSGPCRSLVPPPRRPAESGQRSVSPQTQTRDLSPAGVQRGHQGSPQGLLPQ